jgi:hypothetical protein
MNKSSSWLANSCHEAVGPNLTKGYSIGEPDFAIGKTDFEYWGRLWKACASDPEVDGEEWLTFVKLIQEHLKLNLDRRSPELIDRDP